ncbi:MAG: methyltransferase domain-containing protein, partial [bacterium]|nr:methyltransferase domain-containing protein [bacterium]
VDEIKNQQAVWLFNQALSQARRGNLREAIALWRKAIRLEPEWIEPRGHLAFAYFNYGWFSDAIREYQYLIQKGCETAEIHLLLSDIFRILKKNLDSQRHRAKAEQLDTRLREQYSSLASIPYQSSPKNIVIRWVEEILWYCRFPRPIELLRYAAYLLDLMLISGMDIWRKHCTDFYNQPWMDKNSIKISLFSFIRFHRKYQPEFLYLGLIYNRNIEFMIALNWVNAKSGQRIIDIGAGQSSMLATLVKKGCEVYITDGDPYVLDLKTSLLETDLRPAIESGKLHIEVADAMALPYPDNFFDRVVSIGTLEHIPKDGDMIACREIYRILRPGGYAIITLEADWQYQETRLLYPGHMGLQYAEESGTQSTERGPKFLLFVRSYDDKAIIERVVKASGLALVKFGYYADSVPFRALFDDKRYQRSLGHFQPFLSAVFYRRSFIGIIIILKS